MGHTVTALYELIPPGEKAAKQDAEKTDEVDSLKYQIPSKKPVGVKRLTDAAKTGELLTLWLRHKKPDADLSRRIEFSLKDSNTSFNRASKDFQFASAVASFGMLLRDSKHRGTATLSAVEEIASGAVGDDRKGYRTEFLDLVRRAEQLRR